MDYTISLRIAMMSHLSDAQYETSHPVLFAQRINFVLHLIEVYKKSQILETAKSILQTLLLMEGHNDAKHDLLNQAKGDIIAHRNDIPEEVLENRLNELWAEVYEKSKEDRKKKLMESICQKAKNPENITDSCSTYGEMILKIENDEAHREINDLLDKACYPNQPELWNLDCGAYSVWVDESLTHTPYIIWQDDTGGWEELAWVNELPLEAIKFIEENLK